jgi:serine phosphatase RsbU (regulator of sigma subunit)
MSTQGKIMVLLLVTFGIFIGVFVGYLYIKSKQEEIFIKANAESKTLVIDNILRFKAKSFLGPVNDYSCWDEMVNYVIRPTREWEEVNLSTLEAFGVSNTWIFNKDFKPVFSIFDSLSYPEGETIELSKDIIESAIDSTGICHFFMVVRDTLLEITGATIVNSDDLDHKTPAQGYFFVGKFWGKEYIETMESEMDFAISFRPLNQELSINEEESNIVVNKVVKDAFGKDLMHIDFVSRNKIVSEISNTNKLSTALIGLLLVALIVFFLAIRQWITLPLSYINKSLSSESEAYVDKLEKNTSEFGEFATLIRQFFEQKIQLEIEIAERIETQRMVDELYKDTVNLNHELQASEEELRQNLDMTMELNLVLQKQQKEITDSINYAGRIQSALLPPADFINQLEREFFILYKPRSIVSGDFYWVRKIGNKAIIAVADCTGHGVPGGFMSMLGMAYLTEIFSQHIVKSPGEILFDLRKRVVESLHQTGKIGESKDGMDVAICIIDFDKMHMQFAAAYNPMYLVRQPEVISDNVEPKLVEIKGDRMPIGYSLKMNTEFLTHEISVKKNDMVYLFTDGYHDQMSSATKQKFKRNKLRELLMGIHNEPLEEQKNLLDITFEGFRDDYPQVDDVLVFGIRL